MAKKRTTTTRRRSRTVEVDMTGVETGGGGGFHIPEGNYGVKVETVEQTVSENDNDQFKWTFKGVEGKAKGKTFYFYTPLVEQALWKLRETLEALGVEVPDGPMDVDLDELEGLEAVGAVEDDEYRGKIRSKLAGLVIDGEADEEEEEEEQEEKRPARRNASGRKKSSKQVKLSEDEVKEMSEDELEGVVEKYSLELDLADHKTLRKKAAAVIEELSGQDLIE